MIGIISDLKFIKSKSTVLLEWVPLVQLIVNVLLNNFLYMCLTLSRSKSHLNFIMPYSDKCY